MTPTFQITPKYSYSRYWIDHNQLEKKLQKLGGVEEEPSEITGRNRCFSIGKS